MARNATRWCPSCSSRRVLYSAVLVSLVSHASVLLWLRYEPAAEQRSEPLRVVLLAPPQAPEQVTAPPAVEPPPEHPSPRPAPKPDRAPEQVRRRAPRPVRAERKIAAPAPSPARKTADAERPPSPTPPNPPAPSAAAVAHLAPAAGRRPVEYAHCPPPPYPPRARRLRLEGEVLIRAEVLPSGRAGTLRLQHSSGHELLDEAALAAVHDWRFRPAREDGSAVASWVEIPVRFRLTN